MSEEGTWIERDGPDDIPEPAKPKRAKLMKPKIVEEMELGMPRSDVAEEGILSCCLQSSEYCESSRATIPPEHFYHAGNRLIYGEILHVHGEGKPVDIVTMSQHIIDKGIMEKIGGPYRLAELLNFVPTPVHFPYYRDILTDKAKIRSVLTEADEIKSACRTCEEDILEVAKVVVELSTKMISTFQYVEKEKQFEDYLNDTVQFWQDTKDHKIKSSIPSPWKCWNYELGGVKKGYALLMGPRKSGKSSLAKDLALNAALQHGKRTDYYSYEMSEMSIIMRMVADLSGQDSRMIFSPDLFPPEKDQEKKIAAAFSRLARAPLRITHQPGKDVDWISYRSKKWQSELVIVDYLQLLPKPGGLDPKAGYEREVSENSRRLQVLCGELDASLFVLGQLNKDGESRWSSGPENDIDLCLRIEADGILVKSQRNGPSGMTLPLIFNPGSFKFEEVESPFPS